MGAFAYSEEEGTDAAKNFEDSISQEVKEERLRELMELQEGISAEICGEKVGKTLKTIIDRKEGDYYIGRTEYDSPEVDGEVLVKAGNRRLKKGNFYAVTITDANEFDLFGEIKENGDEQ